MIMVSFNKRALMGIGTLIIFIATILVAAVAAAVLISTSNVLQQRSLLVGQEARKSITDGIEVVSILTASDYIDEEFNNFEILIRLSPGSDALQMRTFSLQYTGPNFDAGSTLAFSDNQTRTTVGVNMVAGTFITIHDLDDDGTNDSVRLITDFSGAIEALQFNLSDTLELANVSLGRDLANAGTTGVRLDVETTGIYSSETFFGVVTVNGTTNTDDQIDANVNVVIEQYASIDNCDFDVLPLEDFYCFEVVNGNNDYVLSSGERFKILYRLTEANELGTGEDFSFIFTTDKGRLSEARARTPDVVTTTKTKLWPLG